MPVMLDVCAALLSVIAIATCGYAAWSVRRALDVNPNALLLGRCVEARKYESSEWETGIVVAASWHGALRIRTQGGRNAFWVEKDKVHERVRAVVS